MATDRIIDRFDIYARLHNLLDSQVTRDCKLAIGTLGKSRKPGKDVSRRTVASILEAYPDINREWLLDGTGEMTVSANRTPDYPAYPFVDTARAECGAPAGLSATIVEKGLPSVAIPGVPRQTAFFIEASGYSMINKERPELSIPPGALVGVAQPGHNSIMRWGEVYVVATTDGIMIKRLMEDEDPAYVQCLSYNHDDFPPFRMAKEDIYDLARVTCVVPVYLR